MELVVRGDLNAASKSSVEAAMRLPILRASILGLVLAATPASLPSGFLSPSRDYIVLARSDVLACDLPRRLPSEATDGYSRVSVETGAARLWRIEIYDLTDCLRMKAEAI